MSANLMSIPMAGSCSSLAVAAGYGGFTQRVSFESAAARPAGLLRHQATKKTSTLVLVRGTAAREQDEKTLNGVVFEPFREVASSPIVQVPANAHESLARQRFDVFCESAINDQINVEYNASYVYHALFSYFHRDNIALPGLAKYFREQSEEEREHAEMFITYQNKRGGRVKLQSILLPEMEFDNAEKGDALFAMELTLSLEKLVTEKLYALHNVAEEADDVELAHYVKSVWLTEQIQSIKKVSELVAQLRRIGHDGHGVYYWDRALLEKGA